MSSIMRARKGLTGRWEGWEVIVGSSLKPKVGDLRCSGSDARIVTCYRTLSCQKRAGRAARPSRESGFVQGARRAVPAVEAECRLSAEKEDHRRKGPQWARRADSGRSPDDGQPSQVDPF